LLHAADLPTGEGPSADGSGSTLALVGPELACDRLFMLARLVYRMMAGREPADAVTNRRDAQYC